MTDANGAIFDRARFAGCIPGIHEVLRRQGLLGDVVPRSARDTQPGQSDEIDRVIAALSAADRRRVRVQATGFIG